MGIIDERLARLEASVARIDERTEILLQNCPLCRGDIAELRERSWKDRIAIVALACGGTGGTVGVLKVLGILN